MSLDPCLNHVNMLELRHDQGSWIRQLDCAPPGFRGNAAPLRLQRNQHVASWIGNQGALHVHAQTSEQQPRGDCTRDRTKAAYYAVVPPVFSCVASTEAREDWQETERVSLNKMVLFGPDLNNGLLCLYTLSPGPRRLYGGHHTDIPLIYRWREAQRSPIVLASRQCHLWLSKSSWGRKFCVRIRCQRTCWQEFLRGRCP